MLHHDWSLLSDMNIIVIIKTVIRRAHCVCIYIYNIYRYTIYKYYIQYFINSYFFSLFPIFRFLNISVRSFFGRLTCGKLIKLRNFRSGRLSIALKMKNEIAELVAGTRANCAREQLLKIYSKKKREKKNKEKERNGEKKRRI